jgi:hypothetical protein
MFALYVIPKIVSGCVFQWRYVSSHNVSLEPHLDPIQIVFDLLHVVLGFKLENFENWKSKTWTLFKLLSVPSIK